MAALFGKKKEDKAIGEEDWNHLLESSSNLNFGRGPSQIRLSLKSLQAEAQRLSKTTKQNVSSTQIKEFAAKAGINIQDQQQYIAALATASSSKTDSMSISGGRSLFGIGDDL